MARQRRPEPDEHAAEAAAPPQAAAPGRAPARSFGALFFFCLGALAMKLVAGALPPFFSSAFDLLVYAGIAISGAIAYRRFVRRAIEDRRRERARQQARTPR